MLNLRFSKANAKTIRTQGLVISVAVSFLAPKFDASIQTRLEYLKKHGFVVGACVPFEELEPLETLLDRQKELESEYMRFKKASDEKLLDINHKLKMIGIKTNQIVSDHSDEGIKRLRQLINENQEIQKNLMVIKSFKKAFKELGIKNV